MSAFPDTLTPPVLDVIQSYPKDAQKYALDLRELILDTAKYDPRIGPLTETLNWREPSYLTEPSKMGIFVNCKTTLIAGFRDLFADELEFEGTRAIWLNLNAPLPREILSICIGKTLTYNLDK